MAIGRSSIGSFPIAGNRASTSGGGNVTVALTGVTATGTPGSVVVASGDITVALTGVSAIGSVGSVSVGSAARRGGYSPEFEAFRNLHRQSEADIFLLIGTAIQSGMFDD